MNPVLYSVHSISCKTCVTKKEIMNTVIAIFNVNGRIDALGYFIAFYF